MVTLDRIKSFNVGKKSQCSVQIIHMGVQGKRFWFILFILGFTKAIVKHIANMFFCLEDVFHVLYKIK